MNSGSISATGIRPTEHVVENSIHVSLGTDRSDIECVVASPDCYDRFEVDPEVFPSRFSTLRAPVFFEAFGRRAEFSFCGEKKGSPSLFYSMRENGRRWLFGRYAVLVLAALCLAVAGMAATMAPRAAALDGRRLCMYVNGQRLPRLSATRYVVVNYKKKGKCPYVNPENGNLIINQNPVPKLTCEQVSDAVQYQPNYFPDICGILDEDTLYELYKIDRKPFDPNSDIVNHGPVKNFE
jgi:hypothetical protein